MIRLPNHYLLLLIIIWSCPLGLSAQLWGSITGPKGEALSFATVYVKGSSQGTSSNINGEYELQLQPGKYEVVFQYVGYVQQTHTTTLTDAPQRLDIKMEEQAVGLEEVVVTAGEDPAYAIIRKAQGKRKHYLNQIEKYTCDAYMKGMAKILEMPEGWRGRAVESSEGVLDSLGRGVIYLSESISTISYQQPDQYKETMVSSKVSGDDGGFSFNRASSMDFNFYKNTYEINRQVLSPIGKNAMSFYKYRLEGAYLDENGQMVNKIKVIRKRENDPTMGGYIYINEDLWNIHSVDMWVTGEVLGLTFLDTLHFKQVNIPLQDDIWKTISSQVFYDFGILGIKAKGEFVSIYSNYDIAPAFEKKHFKGAVLEVEDEANQRDSSYWVEIRPVPLTLEEVEDYVRKDSLQTVWNSPEYQDSMDQQHNRFGIGSLLGGYSFRNSQKNTLFQTNSPFTAIGYNTVQGYNTFLEGTFTKKYDKDGYRYLRASGMLNYGFSDRQLRGRGRLESRLNLTRFTKFRLEAGREASQFNSEMPMSLLLNTFLSLVGRQNFAKFYDRYYVQANGESELFNGFFMKGMLSYGQREPLVNTTDHSWFYRDSRSFTSNDPIRPDVHREPSFNKHQALTLGLGIRIRFHQEYAEYPNRKVIYGYKYPQLFLEYRKGIPTLGGDTDYDFLSLSIRDDFPIGLYGRSMYNLEGGAFISDKRVPLVDFHHFNGTQATIYPTQHALDMFRMLPYYTYSTTEAYVKFHYEHHFDGIILNRVPLLRRWNAELVLGTHLLYVENIGKYAEIAAGIENLGFGPARIFRVDFVLQFQESKERPGFAVRVGVDL